MSNKNAIDKVPEIKPGKTVEIFACGGQCRGQSHIKLSSSEKNEVIIKKIKTA